jgi:hypothetical protein
VTRDRANQTPGKIQRMINATSRIEEMVSIPRISKFVEDRDSKAKAFNHILKTRIQHDEQLSHEILDLFKIKAKRVVNTPRPLFLIDEHLNLNHAVKIPFLKTKRVEQNEGFS